jgi:uncharacterized protein with GYD domain
MEGVLWDSRIPSYPSSNLIFTGGENLIFISLIKDKEKPTKEIIAKANRLIEKMSKDGVKVHEAYWTLGKYDTVFIFEAPDEKAAMKAMLMVGDLVQTETLVAIPRKEAVKLLD